jgi:hypothetical protein
MYLNLAHDLETSVNDFIEISFGKKHTTPGLGWRSTGFMEKRACLKQVPIRTRYKYVVLRYKKVKILAAVTCFDIILRACLCLE